MVINLCETYLSLREFCQIPNILRNQQIDIQNVFIFVVFVYI